MIGVDHQDAALGSCGGGQLPKQSSAWTAGEEMDRVRQASVGSALLSQRPAEAGSILTAVAGFSSGNTVESLVLGLPCGYLVSCLLESVGF